MKSKLLVFFLIITGASVAQQTDKRLSAQIEDLIKGFHGDIGVYVHDLKHNRIVAINADTIFPTASIVKILILIDSPQFHADDVLHKSANKKSTQE